MTLAATEAAAPGRRALPQLPVIIAAVYAILVLSALFQLPDPMIRHDDYPAFLAQPELFYGKTLTEGRWVNYLWHLRGVVTPAWLNFLVYQFFWAVYLSCLVHNAFGREAAVWQQVMVALVAGLCMPWIVISLWFNTLVPGMAIVALYAWLATRLSERACRWLMLAFVPVSLMCYTTFPFLILALPLTRARITPSAKDLAGIVALFIGSFAFGMLVIYLLNYAVHGVFGVPMAQWRNPHPAHDLASALENGKLAGQFLVNLARNGSYDIGVVMALQGAVLAAAVWSGLQHDKWRTVYMLSGAGLGLGLILLQVIRTGIDMPVRSGGFLSIYFAVFLGMFAMRLSRQGRVRLGRNLLFGTAVLYVIFTAMTHYFYSEWPRLSRAMAAELAGGTGPVYVTGTYLSLEAVVLSDLQTADAVESRLAHLTGRRVIMCEQDPQACAAVPQDLRAGLQEQGGFQVRNLEAGSVLMLSPVGLREDKLEAARRRREKN